MSDANMSDVNMSVVMNMAKSVVGIKDPDFRVSSPDILSGHSKIEFCRGTVRCDGVSSRHEFYVCHDG